MSPPDRDAHVNNFDFVRVVAALFVVVSHQFALTGLPEPTFLNVHTLGGLGVLVFFSVSGYLVAQSWQADPHVLRFAARRLLRIWPGLAAVILLSAFAWGPLVSELALREYLRHPALRDYLQNLVFSMRGALPVHFQGNALPSAVNGPLWTIPLELKCYLVLAVLGMAGLLRSRWWVLALTTVLVVRYAVIEARGDQLAAGLGWTLEQHFLLEFGLFFAAGVILQSLDLSGWRTRATLFVAAAFAGVAAIALGRPLLGLWFIVPTSVILLGTATTPYLRRAGRFGDVSYGLYIFAFPIQQTFIWLNQGRLGWGPLFAATLVACLGVAFASWHLVEKRALRLKPRRPSRRVAPPALVTPAAAPAAP